MNWKLLCMKYILAIHDDDFKQRARIERGMKNMFCHFLRFHFLFLISKGKAEKLTVSCNAIFFHFLLLRLLNGSSE